MASSTASAAAAAADLSSSTQMPSGQGGRACIESHSIRPLGFSPPPPPRPVKAKIRERRTVVRDSELADDDERPTVREQGAKRGLPVKSTSSDDERCRSSAIAKELGSDVWRSRVDSEPSIGAQHCRSRSHFSIPDVTVTSCDEDGKETRFEVQLEHANRRMMIWKEEKDLPTFNEEEGGKRLVHPIASYAFLSDSNPASSKARDGRRPLVNNGTQESGKRKAKPPAIRIINAIDDNSTDPAPYPLSSSPSPTMSNGESIEQTRSPDSQLSSSNTLGRRLRKSSLPNLFGKKERDAANAAARTVLPSSPTRVSSSTSTTSSHFEARIQPADKSSRSSEEVSTTQHARTSNFDARTQAAGLTFDNSPSRSPPVACASTNPSLSSFEKLPQPQSPGAFVESIRPSSPLAFFFPKQRKGSRTSDPSPRADDRRLTSPSLTEKELLKVRRKEEESLIKELERVDKMVRKHDKRNEKSQRKAVEQRKKELDQERSGKPGREGESLANAGRGNENAKSILRRVSFFQPPVRTGRASARRASIQRRVHMDPAAVRAEASMGIRKKKVKNAQSGKRHSPVERCAEDIQDQLDDGIQDAFTDNKCNAAAILVPERRSSQDQRRSARSQTSKGNGIGEQASIQEGATGDGVGQASDATRTLSRLLDQQTDDSRHAGQQQNPTEANSDDAQRISESRRSTSHLSSAKVDVVVRPSNEKASIISLSSKENEVTVLDGGKIQIRAQSSSDVARSDGAIRKADEGSRYRIDSMLLNGGFLDWEEELPESSQSTSPSDGASRPSRGDEVAKATSDARELITAIPSHSRDGLQFGHTSQQTMSHRSITAESPASPTLSLFDSLYQEVAAMETCFDEKYPEEAEVRRKSIVVGSSASQKRSSAKASVRETGIPSHFKVAQLSSAPFSSATESFKVAARRSDADADFSAKDVPAQTEPVDHTLPRHRLSNESAKSKRRERSNTSVSSSLASSSSSGLIPTTPPLPQSTFQTLRRSSRDRDGVIGETNAAQTEVTVDVALSSPIDEPGNKAKDMKAFSQSVEHDSLTLFAKDASTLLSSQSTPYTVECQEDVFQSVEPEANDVAVRCSQRKRGTRVGVNPAGFHFPPVPSTTVLPPISSSSSSGHILPSLRREGNGYDDAKLARFQSVPTPKSNPKGESHSEPRVAEQVSHGNPTPFAL